MGSRVIAAILLLALPVATRCHAHGWKIVSIHESETFEMVDHRAATGAVEVLRQLSDAVERELAEPHTAADPKEREQTLYFLAFVEWRLSQVVENRSSKERKKLLKRAQSTLEELLEARPDHGEAHALRGSVIGDRIGGAFGGMMLGPKATAALDRAFELAPDNPRVALQRGIGHFFTPKTFGGGLERAETELKRALDLFSTTSAGTEWPFWGHVDALAWLGQVYAKTDRPDEARTVYRRALALQPEHRWIRDELLPAVE